MRAGLLSLSVLLIGLVGLGCEHRERKSGPPPDSLGPAAPDQITWDAHFTLEEDSRPRASITAGRMEQYQTDDSTYSVWRALVDTGRVRSYAFDEQGDSSATIVADSVVYFDRQGRFEAYGNVVLTTADGRRLESEHLTWNQQDRTIRTRRFVRITTPTEEVRGNGLVAEEDLETYRIGEFTAEVEVEENPDDP